MNKEKFILEFNGLCQEIADKGFNIYDNPNEPLVIKYREMKRQMKELN